MKKNVKVFVVKSGGEYKVTKIVNAAFVPHIHSRNGAHGVQKIRVGDVVEDDQIDNFAGDRRWECTISASV